MFQSLPNQRPFALVLLKRLCLVVLSAFLVIGLISAYRAWYQVHSLNLRLTCFNGHVTRYLDGRRDDTPCRVMNGSGFEADLVSYARTHIDVRLELVQGTNAQTLTFGTLPGNQWGFWDPRTRQRSFKTVLTDEVLNHFQPGRAKLRATATGRHQWMRLPPPVVREMTVELPGKYDKS
jgi:hypothetical protein